MIGEGRAFSSGIDTSVFTDGAGAASIMGDRAARHPDPTIAGILAIQDTFTWLETAPYVTIAAMHGYAFGAGLQLALACDLRVMGTGTRLGLLELQYGILPDLGGTQRLPRLVGPSKALQLIVTGARIGADEASRIGLADVLVADDAVEDTARALADQIAAQPPLAVRGAKPPCRPPCRGAASPTASSSRPRCRPSVCAPPTWARPSPRSSTSGPPSTRAPEAEIVAPAPRTMRGWSATSCGLARPSRDRVSGMTKNAGCKQMAAALLAPGVTTLRNMTPVADLDVMVELLEAIGATVRRDGDVVTIDAATELVPEAPYEHVRRMRASINVLGPLLRGTAAPGSPCRAATTSAAASSTCTSRR